MSGASALSISAVMQRAVRDGLLLAGLLFNLALVFVWGIHRVWIDSDSWRNIDFANLYGLAEQSLTTDGAFRFAPPIAWLIAPIGALPFPIFIGIWLSLDLAAVALLARRFALVALLAFPPVFLELLNTNIHLFLAVAIWAGMRWPAAWAFVILTKVTPGIGAVWFAARREWGRFGTAIGASILVLAVGGIIAPGLTFEWLRSLVLSAGDPVPSPLPPLPLRLVAALGLVWWAARSNRPWLVPVASVLAMPTVWIESTAMLLASLPLWRERGDTIPTCVERPIPAPVPV